MCDEYPEYKQLTEIESGIPVDNSCCERFVSALNRIKPKICSRLDIAATNWLMLIMLNGPEMSAVDWVEILDIWKGNGAKCRYSSVWQIDNTALATELQDAYNSAQL